MNYPGKELEIFDKAHFWRNYTYLLVKKFIGKKILEVGAGLGSFTKVYIKEKYDITLKKARMCSKYVPSQTTCASEHAKYYLRCAQSHLTGIKHSQNCIKIFL